MRLRLKKEESKFLERGIEIAFYFLLLRRDQEKIKNKKVIRGKRIFLTEILGLKWNQLLKHQTIQELDIQQNNF